MFPAEDSAARPSPMQVEYASMEGATCGRHTPSSESATTAESATGRDDVVGALARVSAGDSRIDMCPSCCALARGAARRNTPIARHATNGRRYCRGPVFITTQYYRATRA